MNHENMKMTEVGWIPKDWEVKTLGEVGSIMSGGTPSTSNLDFWNGDINWFTPSEITNSPKYVSSSERKITKLGVDNSGARLLPIGTILLTTRASIGDCAILEKEGTTNQGFHPIIVNEEITNNEFIYYVLGSLKGEMLKNSLGSTFLEISPTNLKSIRFALPTSPSEQRRIAQVLSDTDSLIASLSRTIEKKRLVKQGAMQQLLTGKTRLKGFSGEWVEKELGEVVYVLDNKRLPLNDSQRKHGIYPYCGANGIVDYIDDYIFDEELILMAEDGGNFGDYETRPIAYIMQGKYWVNNHAHVLKAREEYCQRFIYHSIAHKNITDLIIGGTRAKLNQAVLKGIGITMPPTFDEQFAIANILTTMDNEIVSLEAELQKYKALKQGMMQKLLTGQIRLK